ncbi:MAG: hypothetical protein ACYCYP_13040 [Leptospirales bacterium]
MLRQSMGWIHLMSETLEFCAIRSDVVKEAVSKRWIALKTKRLDRDCRLPGKRMQDNGGLFFKIPGKIKVWRTLGSSTGKWWVTLSCENVREESLPIRIDVGIKTFAFLLDGTEIRNPEVFRQSAKRLAQAQRRLPLQEIRVS